MRRTLSFKFTFGFILLGLLVSAAGGAVGYVKYKNNIEKFYNDNAYRIAAVARSYVDGDQVEKFLAAGVIDDSYETVRAQFNTLRESMGASYIYVAGLVGEDLTYVYDADNPAASHEAYKFGRKGKINPAFKEDAARIMATGERSANYFYSRSHLGYNTSAIIPLRNSSGAIVGVVGVMLAMSDIQSALLDYLTVAGILTFTLIFLIVWLYLLYLRRRIIRPIDMIAKDASTFVERKNIVDSGLLDVKTGDEIETLARSLHKLQEDINHYIDNLSRVTAEKERIGAELDIARQIQASMLPNIFPPFPERPEFDLYATMLPAKEVGGDFYDFFLVGDDLLAVVMADVSGKGVPAALFMVIARTLIKNTAQNGKSPKEVFEAVNDLLADNNEAGMFVTAFMGYLEISTGRFTYVNAGHNPPILRRAGAGCEFYKGPRGFVLAGLAGMRYKESETFLHKGDLLYLYTDGVTEAADVNEELFTEERLLEVFDEHKDAPLTGLLGAIKTRLDAFAGEAEQADDITMLGLRVL